MGVKFFTTPPKPYPYIIVNVRYPDLRYLRYAKEVIIDSGVKLFDKGLKEYPKDHEERIAKTFIDVRRVANEAKVYVVVPDYPDDEHMSLWIGDRTNIERTVENVLRYVERYPWIPWMPVIQYHSDSFSSVLKCISLYQDCGILDKFDYFGIPFYKSIGARAIRLVRNVLKHKRLHAFGVGLKDIKRVAKYIDSFDSTGYTRRPCGDHFMCKNRNEMRRFFDEWIEKLKKIGIVIE